MLEIIGGLPERVLGIRARGEVTASDYHDVVIPEIEQRLVRFPRLGLIYVFDQDFSGFSLAAAWEDSKVGMRHLTHFDRICVVSDTEWINHAVRAFGFVIPGEVRVFGNGELEAAKDWVSEPQSEGRLDYEFDSDAGLLTLKPQGKLEAADFRRLAADIDPFIESVGGLAGILIISEAFPGWEDFAAFSSHFRFIREHHDKIRRVAVVTDSRFLSALPRLAGLFVDAELKRFDMGDQAAARAWVSGRG